ncbi:General substrate transporter [Metarhizium guizhouense ARSEF 977]|uniref:General substrate transporter n=1 Tax=Metarhizium guizhouense (strain ARSEF 977) TaxID=1276136 RepID=A0A0B4HWB3_METGA|nr:General substrate transporter [Metarhizium guizhouense ARSEF 977]
MVLTGKGRGPQYLGGSGDALTVWISIAAGTVLVFYGYDQGVFGNVLVTQDFLDTMGNPSAQDQGTMTSVYNLGCFAGALSTLYSGDKFGRPRTLILGSLIIAIGAVIQAASWGTAQIHYPNGKLHHRLLLVKLAHLGLLVRSGQRIMAISTSLPSLQVVPSLLLFGKDILTSEIVFSGLIMLICPFLPDSPRLLIRKGKYDEAHDVLAALQGNDATADSPSVRTQFSIIKGILDTEYAVTYTWWQLFTGKGPAGVVRRMILGAWMQAMNQISGINVTSYYMTYVFIHSIGLNELLSRILAAAGSVDYLIFSFLAYFVVERYGRRKVMMTSAAGCALCWLIISIALGLSEAGRGDSFKLGVVAVSFFFVFFACFAMGVLGVPWLYPTEINALAFRSQGASLAMATNWIMNYMVAQITPPGIENLGYKFWIIWAVICASFVPTTYFFYPETANRSLEDIDRFFADNPGIFVFRHKIATQLQRPSIYEEAVSRVAHRNENISNEKLATIVSTKPKEQGARYQAASLPQQ